MKIVLFTRLFWPHIGGVEKHVHELSKRLIKRGNDVRVITTRYEKELKKKESKDNIKITRFYQPKAKFVGLLKTWFWFLKNIDILRKADVIHVHDVFIWYIPFRFFFPKKRVFTTFHGWEGEYPIPFKNKIIKKLSAWLSTRNICVGVYIEKYYGIKADIVTYGAVDTTKFTPSDKKKNLITYVGRLEEDTGLLDFLNWLEEKNRLEEYRVIFLGDGELKDSCEKYGNVKGFVDPSEYLSKAEICVPSGYLTCLEAMASRCKILVFWDNTLKKDYWKMTPFYKWIKNEKPEEGYNWAIKQTWEKMTDDYEKLWEMK